MKTNSISPFLLCIGYAGYIQGVKSENLYGQTYGKTTFTSSAGTFERGIDQAPDKKFNTTMKNEFTQHDANKHETTAQIVGVNRGPETYKKVSYRLWLAVDEMDAAIQFCANNSNIYSMKDWNAHRNQTTLTALFCVILIARSTTRRPQVLWMQY